MISPLLSFSVIALSLVAYVGAIGVAWTGLGLQRTCATGFIHNIILFSSIAIAFSVAAAFVQFARLRWLTPRNSRGQGILLLSGAPAVGVIIFWVVSLAVVASSAPNKALQPTRATEPTSQREPARSGARG